MKKTVFSTFLKKTTAFLLALVMSISLAVGVSAAETKPDVINSGYIVGNVWVPSFDFAALLRLAVAQGTSDVYYVVSSGPNAEQGYYNMTASGAWGARPTGPNANLLQKDTAAAQIATIFERVAYRQDADGTQVEYDEGGTDPGEKTLTLGPQLGTMKADATLDQVSYIVTAANIDNGPITVAITKGTAVKDADFVVSGNTLANNTATIAIKEATAATETGDYTVTITIDGKTATGTLTVTGGTFKVAGFTFNDGKTPKTIIDRDSADITITGGTYPSTGTVWDADKLFEDGVPYKLTFENSTTKIKYEADYPAKAGATSPVDLVANVVSYKLGSNGFKYMDQLGIPNPVEVTTAAANILVDTVPSGTPKTYEAITAVPFEPGKTYSISFTTTVSGLTTAYASSENYLAKIADANNASQAANAAIDLKVTSGTKEVAFTNFTFTIGGSNVNADPGSITVAGVGLFKPNETKFTVARATPYEIEFTKTTGTAPNAVTTAYKVNYTPATTDAPSGPTIATEATVILGQRFNIASFDYKTAVGTNPVGANLDGNSQAEVKVSGDGLTGIVDYEPTKTLFTDGRDYTVYFYNEGDSPDLGLFTQYTGKFTADVNEKSGVEVGGCVPVAGAKQKIKFASNGVTFEPYQSGGTIVPITPDNDKVKIEGVIVKNTDNGGATNSSLAKYLYEVGKKYTLTFIKTESNVVSTYLAEEFTPTTADKNRAAALRATKDPTVTGVKDTFTLAAVASDLIFGFSVNGTDVSVADVKNLTVGDALFKDRSNGASATTFTVDGTYALKFNTVSSGGNVRVYSATYEPKNATTEAGRSTARAIALTATDISGTVTRIVLEGFNFTLNGTALPSTPIGIKVGGKDFNDKTNANPTVFEVATGQPYNVTFNLASTDSAGAAILTPYTATYTPVAGDAGKKPAALAVSADTTAQKQFKLAIANGGFALKDIEQASGTFPTKAALDTRKVYVYEGNFDATPREFNATTADLYFTNETVYWVEVVDTVTATPATVTNTWRSIEPWTANFEKNKNGTVTVWFKKQ